MARERISIQKQSYNRKQIRTVIDTEFKTYVDPIEEADNDTVEELFRLYDKLFYNIPIEGDLNSHKYILTRSSELADFEKDTEEIQPLLDEIAQLRQQLLDANEQIFELENDV